MSNARWEAFAQGLSRGETGDEAYAKAGYKPNRNNASRLKANESIRARVAELQERGQRMSDITKERLTEMLLQDREDAREAGQYAASISAVEKVGKLHGLFVDKSESVNTNFVISDEPELDADEWLTSYAPN